MGMKLSKSAFWGDNVARASENATRPQGDAAGRGRDRGRTGAVDPGAIVSLAVVGGTLARRRRST